MTQQLEQIIERLHHLDHLPEDEQARIAERIAATLDEVDVTDPMRRRAAEAAARMRERRKGNYLPEGLTIRDMIEEGRR